MVSVVAISGRLGDVDATATVAQSAAPATGMLTISYTPLEGVTRISAIGTIPARPWWGITSRWKTIDCHEPISTLCENGWEEP